MTEFQVMCVAKLGIIYLPEWAEGMHVPCPEIGSEYTVCGIVKRDGLLYYEIVGFVRQEMDARAFAILPGLTADEIDEIEKETIIR